MCVHESKRRKDTEQIFVKIEFCDEIFTLDVDLKNDVPKNVLRMLSNKLMFTYPELSAQIDCRQCYKLIFACCNITHLDLQILSSLGISRESTLHAVRVFGLRCPMHGKPYRIRPCDASYLSLLRTYRDNHMIELVKARKQTHSTIVDDVAWLETMAAGARSFFMKDDMQGAHFFLPNEHCYSDKQSYEHEHVAP